VLGARPSNAELSAYLEAYFGDRLSDDQINSVISKLEQSHEVQLPMWLQTIASLIGFSFGSADSTYDAHSLEITEVNEASAVVNLLVKSTEEMDSVVVGLEGGFIKPGAGGGKFFSRFA
jgi:magnesium chelatase subunit H